MGYRQYFYEVDKAKVEGIRRCKTEEELYNTREEAEQALQKGGEG